MTTRGVQSPTAIHFSIDGRPSVLEARHIAEALQIPYELEVGRLFCTSWSPSHGSTTSASTARAWRAPDRDHTTNATPEATSIAPPTTPTVPLVAPTTSESSITIWTSKFRVLHLGLLPPPQPDLPTSSAPIALPEDTTPTEVRIPPP
ncbi:hypothetical protein CK203_116075 [Vitis vinifera]|uniref:Uncharacterized protein n=1 Tax=Vitis vinifera TaxID=29760 RepID=A0A438BLX5_VITVI|nr:hypothetical protein CK203_116075 [Vitis vinifera]